MAQQIDVTLEELHQMHDRIGRRTPQASDFPVIGALLTNYIAKYEARIERLRAKGEAVSQAATTTNEVIDAEFSVISDGTGESASGEAAGQSGIDSPAPKEGKGNRPKAPGHGRNGAAAYTGANHFTHNLPDDTIGSLCTCGKGRMHSHRETVIIRIVGQPLFGAQAHHYQQARCKVCGRVIAASGPSNVQQGIGKSVIYSYSACAMLAVMHYFGYAPFKRLESLHAGWGIPLADSNQWEVSKKGDNFLRPLYDTVERVGMQTASNIRIDDTGSFVVSIMRQIKEEKAALAKLGESTDGVRDGINATGVYLETPAGVVILHYTGLHHAGEILDRLMEYRDGESAPLTKVTDGASKNFSHDNRDRLIEAVCNTHCLLKFESIKTQYPEQYALAGEVYNKIYGFDKFAKEQRMTPEERMAFHATHSKPLMEKLRDMCLGLIENRRVEPNSHLWKPVSFVVNQWQRLTKFFEVPGVPLDTNLVEQVLITQVRYLAGSFNYQTKNGSGVGDRYMSLIASAKANGVEPVAYLEDCLANHEDLARRPEYYLPWVWRDRHRPSAHPPDHLPS